MDQSPLFPPPSVAPLSSRFHPDTDDHVIWEGDARDLLTSMPDGSAKLIITSPPYNIGKDYEEATSLEQYLADHLDLLEELMRVLHPEGSLCWQVGNFVDRGEIIPLDIPYFNIFHSHGLKLRNRIVWTFNHGLHASRRFSGRYETILWFTKSDHYTFNLDPVRVPSMYPGKRHYKGPKAGQPSGNPLGKNPSDIWRVVAQDWEAEIWEIPNVKANHPEKTNHPCQYPIELVQRCVLALTDEHDIVLDPFAGVGTAVLAAAMSNRRGVGAEWTPEYAQLSRERFDAFSNGTLKYRMLGKEIHKPTGREKVSQVPSEWKD